MFLLQFNLFLTSIMEGIELDTKVFTCRTRVRFRIAKMKTLSPISSCKDDAFQKLKVMMRGSGDIYFWPLSSEISLLERT